MEKKPQQMIFDKVQLPPEIDNPRWKDLVRTFNATPVERTDHIHVTEGQIRDLKLKPGSRLLEIGAGVGLNAYELASRGVIVTDMDIVPPNVELVNYVAGQLGLPVTAMNGDSCALPFPDNEFDATFSKSVFEHIHDQEKALDEQIRVLKPGGRLMIMDGNLTGLTTLYDMLFVRPKQSKGKQGGLGWLFRKGQAHEDYGMGWHGKEEDIKTIWWWKHQVRKRRDLITPVNITTTRAYYFPDKPIYRFLAPLIGMVVVICEKKA